MSVLQHSFASYMRAILLLLLLLKLKLRGANDSGLRLDPYIRLCGGKHMQHCSSMVQHGGRQAAIGGCGLAAGGAFIRGRLTPLP